MSRKARSAPRPRELDPVEPMTGGPLHAALLLVAVMVVVLVGVLFKLDVNRVFDVPKALVLKVGGAGIFLVWLLEGLFGRGWPSRSIQLFLGPVAALLGAVILSTLSSLDVSMSLYGVYERQFGLQGFLGCVGLFVVTASGLRSRHGAFAALATLTLIGGAIGAYAFLQATGNDPFGFFTKPHNKTYSYLGNATFAGNALALIFPMSMVLAGLASLAVLRASGDDAESNAPERGRYFVGLLGGLVLALGPGYFAATRLGMGTPSAESLFALSVGALLLAPVLLAAMGSGGPEWTRSSSEVTRRRCDAMAAGALVASTICLAAGVVTTRTRGAWVGASLALLGGAILLPKLFKDAPEIARRVKLAAWGVFGLLATAVVGLMLLFPNHVWSETIKSIPKAFDPQKQVLGRGQGTRPYLWSESPRVLVDHTATLERIYRDRAERTQKVRPEGFPDLDLRATPMTEGEQAFDRLWRRTLVWATGIGIETYRYAFMSHKSKKLESLDPMTNHDNPHNNYLYVLASFGLIGLAAYLWLLVRLLRVSYRRFSGGDGKNDSLAARAIAFGVVTSFFSYAFYSIAGFDSVACSVFFYFMLGSAAAYFEPNGDAPAQDVVTHLRLAWSRALGRADSGAPRTSPMLAKVVLAAGLTPLLLNAMWGGFRVYAAEREFVGDTTTRRDLLQKIEDIKEAIRTNPLESYYKQSLGTTLVDGARQLRAQASRLQASQRTSDAKLMLDKADELSSQAETALFAALDHAWAPENVFISLFQLYYGMNRLDEAEYALKRALEHSPHLGPVRANLAILELERHANAEALADCQWVLDIDPYSAIALRTCGRASYLLGRMEEAQSYLQRAASAAPTDGVVKSYIAELQRARATPTATATAGG